MKKLILIYIIFISAFIINGCYTVVWTPFVDAPAQSEGTTVYNNYYYSPSWDYYYNYPWWYGVSLPTRNQDTYINTRETTNTSTTRNDDGGRRGSNERDIIFTNPSRDQGSGNTGTNNESTTNSNNNSSSNNSRDSKNNKSGSTRNDDGGRNTSNPRR